MRQSGIGIGNFIKIEKNRPRNMGGTIIGAGIMIRIRQVPGGIKNANIGGRQMLLQPIGGNQWRWCLAFHRATFEASEKDDMAIKASTLRWHASGCNA
ncbi:hypothetical protein JCM17846_12070 [Iodidimonas nitroreducens]|uniref:Uncharacterized protein n=1 Tax=Iodidimonas nitroreducens TaxID=1236968 RepID=A0A5A7N7A3_9PROT|nr:hypothetical protein JCM17846_12070 [Iodidimonas nitroreducens]